MERAAPGGGNRELYHGIEACDKGTVTVEWKQTLEEYRQGPGKPGVETLFTMRLRSGEMFFHVGFLGGSAGDGGAIVTSKSEIGRWQPGKSMDFKVVMNLDDNTCDISIDGKVCAEDVAVNRPAAMNGVLFKDGSGLGLQDGNFTVSLDDVLISYTVVAEKELARHRTIPPLNNPPPAYNPKPADAKAWTVPGEVVTSWVGNSHSGSSGKGGHQNGFGEWTQNGISSGSFVVLPDGSILAGVGWDEAGRCIGLYKDGKVNTRLVAQYDMRGGHSAWGFGSSNESIAMTNEWIFACNQSGELMRFRWKSGDLDSHHWHDQLELGKDRVAISMTAAGNRLAALFKGGEVSVWEVSSDKFTTAGKWQAPAKAAEICYAPDGGFWVVADNEVMKVTADGTIAPQLKVPDPGVPTAVAVAPDGTLLVCDNGPRQQVRFYDVSGATPRLIKTFGDEGGLRSGTPGVPTDRKLWGLRGAGVDAAGNLYVGCCLHPSSRGTVIKAFDKTGNLIWDSQCHAFTDGYGFDPEADGTEIVGADELISLDLRKPPGKEWSLKAITLDPIRYPKDIRVTASGHDSCGAFLRIVGGRRLLYTIGMQSGGLNLFPFEEGPGHVAFHAGGIGERGTWAWNVDDKGDIWLGDSAGNKVKRYRFVKWEGDKPVFSEDQPDVWPAPDGYDKIQRVHYDNKTDRLYVGGFPKGVKDPAWGEVGAVLDCYESWTAGKPRKLWSTPLPVDDENVYPKAMAIAGDHAFIVSVKPNKGRTGLITVYGLKDGKTVGEIWPGAEVGGLSGWVDISHAISAHKRKDGEYLILVEEDFRGKCMLYRWKPAE